MDWLTCGSWTALAVGARRFRFTVASTACSTGKAAIDGSKRQVWGSLHGQVHFIQSTPPSLFSHLQWLLLVLNDDVAG